MNIRLDWQIGGDDEEPPERKGGRWSVSLTTAVLALFFILLLLLGWQLGRRQVAQADARLLAQVQSVLDGQQAAFAAGDGDLFFTYFTYDPGWQAVQLRPSRQVVFTPGRTATRAEQHGDDVWVNLTWTDPAGQSWQQVAFFQWQGSQLVQVPTADNYWGSPQRNRHSWGSLIIGEHDEQWASQIAAFVAELIDEQCHQAEACWPGSYPFNLTIAPDYQMIAAPRERRVPSPRLLALTATGQPGEPFWAALRQEVLNQLTPAQIRYAIPEEQMLTYQMLLNDFMADQPGILVELIALEQLPQDPLDWDETAVDAAALVPSEQMLAAGRVLDLTDLAGSDPAFNPGDFYEQHWQGAWWRERMWLMPQAGALPLFFYDTQAYTFAGLEEPSLQWTWVEMMDDLTALQIATAQGRWDYPFLDVGQHTLFGYAYNWEHNSCTGDYPLGCESELDFTEVAAALDWQRQIVQEQQLTLDITATSMERGRIKYNVSAAVWVDLPVSFEHWSQLRTIGVVPFPGSERFEGVTPLWVEGSFILASSERPRAAWLWLNYLSQQRIARQRRLIPARPSVARATSYWGSLPQSLSEVMRAAFPFAPAVTLAERGLFSDGQIRGVLDGGATAVQAAQSQPRLRWFRQEAE